MITVLATLVAAAFLWSVVLFFGAVVYRERRQEHGFGWALAGAVVFFVVFTDRLPWHWMGPRSALELLPGVSHERTLFASSVAALVVLAVVYAFRIAVFYRLLLSEGVDLDGDGNAEVVNDVVAPALSFFCFAICVVSMLQPVYQLTALETAACGAVLLAVYYGRLLSVLRELVALAEVAVTRLKLILRKLTVRLVQLIARGEVLRRDNDAAGLSGWVRTQLGKIDEATAAADAAEREILAKLARALRSGRGPRRRRSA